MTNQINNQSIIPSTEVIQLTLTLKMTTAQVVEMSVTVNDNSPILDYIHPDDQTQPICEMTPGFKPFTKIQCNNDTLMKAQTRKMTTLFKRETNAESLISTKL